MQTNQQVRKDIGLFSALCLLYVIVMAMVGLIYQTIVTLFQASRYFGNLEKIQKATDVHLHDEISKLGDNPLTDSHLGARPTR